MAGLSLTISGLHRTFGPEPHHYVDVARAAEEAGFAQVVLPDHVVMGDRTDRYPYGEFPMAAGRAVERTLDHAGRDRGGHVPDPAGDRDPASRPFDQRRSLAKIVATLDALSGGRVDLGVGVGWQREEYEAVGVVSASAGPCSTRDDGRAGSSGPGGGAVECVPRPVQERLPVWLGAKCTGKNARRMADWGDGWMPLEARTGPDDAAGGDRSPSGGLRRRRPRPGSDCSSAPGCRW